MAITYDGFCEDDHPDVDKVSEIYNEMQALDEKAFKDIRPLITTTSNKTRMAMLLNLVLEAEAKAAPRPSQSRWTNE